MRILSIDTNPIHEICCRYVRSGGAQSVGQLPVLADYVDRLPPKLDAVILTSDLQARALTSDLLLAEVLAQELTMLANEGLIPSTSRTGIVFAGDLFTIQSLDKRGGYGDVCSAWLAFTPSFRWVTGVPGNHDRFGDTGEKERAFRRSQRIHLLDGDSIELDGVRIVGMGGIIGKPTKPHRRQKVDAMQLLHRLLQQKPEICVLHQGPNVPEHRLFGEPSIRQELLNHKDSVLVVCGHSHWPVPLVDLSSSVQVANVDMRVVVLTQHN
jgi:Icc protein